MKYTYEEMNSKFPNQIDLALFICEQICQDDIENSQWFEDLVENYAFLVAIINKYGWDYKPPQDINFAYAGDAKDKMIGFARSVDQSLSKIKRDDTFEKALSYYQSEFKYGSFYELTDGDISRIQQLINKLRTEINSSNLLNEDHKSRMLHRLEKLQYELHKRMSDYDKAYGIMIDGIILWERFGEGVRPITELIREIGNLFWKAHCRTEQLPGDTVLSLPEKQID
jgi:hypothetical protein